MFRRLLPLLVVALAVAGCADLENPPVTRSVVFVDNATEDLARRACMPCHSHETAWSWYASVPGVSVALVDEVELARTHLNFSTWDRPQDELDDVAEKIREREMPPPMFAAAHPEANLSDEEREQLIAGLLATFAADPPPGGDEDDRDDDNDDNDD